MKFDDYIGVDPGGTGAIAHLRGLDFFVTKYGDRDSFDPNNEIPRNTPVCIENVHALPTDGRSSAFTFGRNTGGVTEFMRMRGFTNVFLAPPTQWQAEFNLQAFNLPFGTENRKPFHKKALYKILGLNDTGKGVVHIPHIPDNLVDLWGFYKVNGEVPKKVINQYVDAMLIALFCRKINGASYQGRK